MISEPAVKTEIPTRHTRQLIVNGNSQMFEIFGIILMLTNIKHILDLAYN